ncbi:MAG: flagellar M-ring protein FliF [Nitrospina sp.]|nr:flagellar M-ring protein FliF [Nitrospina sp.]
MNPIQTIFSQLNERFGTLSQGQKLAALVLTTVTIGSILAMSFWIKTPDLQLLYANLSEQDASAIVDNLKSQKIPYELSNQGKTIRVPANQVHEVRLQMASEGLPEGSEVGLEIFDKTSLGMTDFIQKLNFQRALQGELSRTIKTLDAVEHARVHLVIPKQTLFIREKPKGKASVTIKTKAGKSLNERQVQGIVHLIASSVEGITADSVAVVDVKGNLLSGSQQTNIGAARSSSNYQHRRKVEQELEQNILDMLEDALGQGMVIARVTADLDFEKNDQTEEIYDPDSQVVRSQQTASESAIGATPPGGTIGVQAQLPAGENEGGAGAASQPSKRDKNNQVLNYEINKITRVVSKPTGIVSKLSVAVMIDGTLSEESEYKARTQEEMDQYLQLVQSAVGYNQERGDQIKVENVQFDRTAELLREKEMKKQEQIELAFQVGKYVLGLVFVILFFTRGLKPIITFITTKPEEDEEPEEEVVDDGLTEEQRKEDELMRKLEEGLATAAEMRKSVNDFIGKDPKFTAGVVRKWLRQKAEV